MDKFLIRKDVYEDLIEKGYGKKDLSKLTKKQITDKNGHKRTVYVKNGEQPAAQNQPKAQNELTPEKKARYEEMLEKVKAGSDENALFVRSKGMLNKKDAIAYLSEKLGKKTVSSAAQGHLESDTPQNTDITKEDEERFGKQALYGLSGKRTNSEEYDDTKAFEEYKELVTKDNLTDEDHKRVGQLTLEHFKHSKEPWPGGAKLREESGMWKKRFDSLKVGDEVTSYGTKMKITKKNENNNSFNADFTTEDGEKYNTTLSIMDIDDSSFDKKPSQDDMKENYLDARNEGGRDIADKNRVDSHSKNAINLSDSEVKKMQKLFDYIPENAKGVQIMNTIYDEDKALYKKLSDMDVEYKKLHPEAEGKTFSFDLATKYLEDSFNEYKKNHEVGKDKFAEMSIEDIRKEQQNLFDDYDQYYNAYKNGKNDGSKLREYFKKFDVYKTALDKKSKK